MKNTNLVYGIVGLLVGMGIMGGISTFVSPRGFERGERGLTHQMSDGMMMNNVGMDMGSMMTGMMEGLKGKTGDAFDKAFLSEMIVHHQGAVDMANAVLATSKRPELLKLAQDIIAAQTKEIGMMQEWQKTWFK